jgi:non-ribosomal peptide synthetase component F
MVNDNEKYIIYGGPDPENMGAGCRSVGELFLKQLMMHGERVALVDGVTSDEYTYLEIRSRAIQLARTLQAAGIGKHDVISIVSENRIELPVTMFAAFMCGATVAPVNLTYSDREYKITSLLFSLNYHSRIEFGVDYDNPVFLSSPCTERLKSLVWSTVAIIYRVIR